MNETFQVVYKFLKWISKFSGLTYHEVNIIIYFIVIPAVFIFLISKILKRKTLFIGYLILVFLITIFIQDFEQFSTKLFNKSVDFLNWFELIGLNYIQASVVICVIVPILILLFLFFINKKKWVNKN